MFLCGLTQKEGWFSSCKGARPTNTEKFPTGRPVQWSRCRYSSSGKCCLSRSESLPMVRRSLPSAGYEGWIRNPRQGWWAKRNFRGAGAKGAEEKETGSARIRTRERTGDALRVPTSRRWSAKRIAGRKRRARSPEYGTNGGGWKGR